MKSQKLKIKKLNTIFFNLFKIEPKELSKANMLTCSNWDSLTHVVIDLLYNKMHPKLVSKD